jgi:alpha-galactosidase
VHHARKQAIEQCLKDDRENKRQHSLDTVHAQWQRKFHELDRDYLKLKNKHVRQTDQLERCLRQLNEMTHNHEHDL